ncbi:MAG: universal stress protein [Deltaproteobacteria bacterium]|nr:universal stress protein [Deltaproteobacteria bacterium]
MIRRIVVGYDFTEASDDALSWALELAQPLQATVHVVHIADSSDDSDPKVVERRAALARVADDAGPRVTSQLALGSDVARALVDLSEEGNADLIVVATRQLSAMRRWFLGSVANELIQAAHCPVVTVRSGDDD